MPETARIIDPKDFSGLGEVMSDLSIGDSYYRKCDKYGGSCENGAIIKVNLPGKGEVPCWLSKFPRHQSCQACQNTSKPEYLDLKFNS